MKHYFLVGIGGIGMSAVAELLAQNHKVSGSDVKNSDTLKKLKERGVQIFTSHTGNNLKDVDCLVVSAAIPENNPEIKEAKKRKIPILRRSQVLTMLSRQKYGIFVAGTHGKTTTTTILCDILNNAGLSPTSLIGGEVQRIKGNVEIGKGKYFVAEACEYQRSFLDFWPDMAIVTNIEIDHIDVYRNLSDIKKAFGQFVSQINPKGFLIINSDQDNQSVIKKAKCKVYTFGFNPDCDFYITNVRYQNKKTHFSITKDHKKVNLESALLGNHNVLNVVAAYAASSVLKISERSIKKTLPSIKGAGRRLEVKAKIRGITIIDDYAHHPSEIKATLDALRWKYPDQRIWAVFQPHQYSRTKFFLDDFGKAFGKADTVILVDIFECRDTEKDKAGVSILDLAQKLKENGKEAIYFGNYLKTGNALVKKLNRGDVLLIMGAGNIWEEVGERVIKRLKIRD